MLEADARYPRKQAQIAALDNEDAARGARLRRILVNRTIDAMSIQRIECCACILDAWHAHEDELLGFLSRRTGERAVAEDLLQDVFVRAAGQGERFCRLGDRRAWLFRVARNRLIDHVRSRRPAEDIGEVAIEADELPPLYALEHCLRSNLARMTESERRIIEACDLDRMPQAEYADRHGLSLAATKSRLLRARRKLRRLLVGRCRVRFDDDGRVAGHENPAACRPDRNR
jgi:RNA polymerase sigma-70 factor (ECF subfamily)